MMDKSSIMFGNKDLGEQCVPDFSDYVASGICDSDDLYQAIIRSMEDIKNIGMCTLEGDAKELFNKAMKLKSGSEHSEYEWDIKEIAEEQEKNPVDQ